MAMKPEVAGTETMKAETAPPENLRRLWGYLRTALAADPPGTLYTLSMANLWQLAREGGADVGFLRTVLPEKGSPYSWGELVNGITSLVGPDRRTDLTLYARLPRAEAYAYAHPYRKHAKG